VTEKRRRPIVAIDGPSAAGKSTVGKAVASMLGYTYIDTGALYRAVGWLARQGGFTTDDAADVAELISMTSFGLAEDEGRRLVFVDGTEISDQIRTEEVGHLASTFSALPEVRAGLLDIQRRIGSGGGVVMDGRDIGTVIFPDAEVKVFLTAGDEERSRRRYEELLGRGHAADLDAVRQDLAERDRRDSEREHSPLKKADDAVVIDSTGLTPEEVTAKIAILAREAEGRKGAPQKKGLRVAVLHRKLDKRFQANFPKDIEGRDDDDYVDEILGALSRRGHDAFVFNIREDRLHDLANLDCDIAFNIVEEGLNNDSSLEAHLPALLDIYGIPYTGGDHLAITLAADKAMSKEVLSYHGVPTPAFQLFKTPKDEPRLDLRYPLIVKPYREDAGIGIFKTSVVKDRKALLRQVRKVIRDYRQPAIAEEYIHGRELSVAVFEHRGTVRVSPISEVVFYTRSGSPRVYTYTAKWDDESNEYMNVDPTECPAEDLPPGIEEQVEELAVRAFHAMRLRGYGRIDFRLSEDNRLYIFEINANPLIGEESLMAVLARKMGWYFPTFIHNITMEAWRRSTRERRGVTIRDILRAEREPGGAQPPA
jgi:cytidylate kinase